MLQLYPEAACSPHSPVRYEYCGTAFDFSAKGFLFSLGTYRSRFCRHISTVFQQKSSVDSVLNFGDTDCFFSPLSVCSLSHRRLGRSFARNIIGLVGTYAGWFDKEKTNLAHKNAPPKGLTFGGEIFLNCHYFSLIIFSASSAAYLQSCGQGRF